MLGDVGGQPERHVQPQGQKNQGHFRRGVAYPQPEQKQHDRRERQGVQAHRQQCETLTEDKRTSPQQQIRNQIEACLQAEIQIAEGGRCQALQQPFAGADITSGIAAHLKTKVEIPGGQYPEAGQECHKRHGSMSHCSLSRR